MNKKTRTLIYVFISLVILLLLAIGFLLIIVPDKVSKYDDQILLWTKVGAVGGWIGAIVACVALVISLVSLLAPKTQIITAKLDKGIIFDQTGTKRFNIIDIAIKNAGSKPFTVNNVYIGFDKTKDMLFVTPMANGTPVQSLMPKFPVRLEEGESFEFYIPYDNFRGYLEKEKINGSYKVIAIVDEVLSGKQRINTNVTIDSLLERQQS